VFPARSPDVAGVDGLMIWRRRVIALPDVIDRTSHFVVQLSRTPFSLSIIIFIIIIIIVVVVFVIIIKFNTSYYTKYRGVGVEGYW